jgi:hypothetical protein
VATPLADALSTANYKQTALSSAQATQIREIFELFDTDGGGCIDQNELQFAMTALGFQTSESEDTHKPKPKTKTKKRKEELGVIDAVMGDGKVELRNAYCVLIYIYISLGALEVMKMAMF